MTVAYTKHAVGNKLFTVEWDMSAGDVGAPFEAIDAELKSISALVSSAEDYNAYVRVSNWSTAPEDGQGCSVLVNTGAGNNIIPLSTIEAPLPPMARWYYPQTSGTAPENAVSRIALLFKEV